MGGEAFGPVKVLCPSIVPGSGNELVGLLGEGRGDKGFLERKLGKRITLEM